MPDCNTILNTAYALFFDSTSKNTGSGTYRDEGYAIHPVKK